MSLILDGSVGVSDVDGSAATPAIRGTDANTGMFFPAADTIAFSEGGVESMRIDSSGFVGIGIQNGTAKLTVAGTNANNAGAAATFIGSIQINEAGSFTLASVGGLEFKGSVFGAGYGSKIFSTDDGVLLFGNRSNSATWSERMRIDSSGNVGIGTGAPSDKLSLFAASGNIFTRIQSGSSTWLAGTYSDGTGVSGTLAANHYIFLTGNAERMRISSAGNVGIGTSAPSALLDIARGNNQTALRISNTTNNTYSELLFGLNAFSSSTGYASYIRGHNNGDFDFSSFLTFGTASASSGSIAERVRIDSIGNLLVGVQSTGGGGGTVTAIGNFMGRAGISGAESNRFVINWTGSPQLWIDATNVGTIQLSSDYRIKRNIETQTAPALERVMALRPVTYQMADYGDLFKSGDDIKEGFIAHEVQEVIPSGVDGVKDDPVQIQSLRVDAMLAVAVKAIQEQQAMIEELKAKVAALEAA